MINNKMKPEHIKVISKLLSIDKNSKWMYESATDWSQHCMKYKCELPPNLKGK